MTALAAPGLRDFAQHRLGGNSRQSAVSVQRCLIATKGRSGRRAWLQKNVEADDDHDDSDIAGGGKRHGFAFFCS